MRIICSTDVEKMGAERGEDKEGLEREFWLMLSAIFSLQFPVKTPTCGWNPSSSDPQYDQLWQSDFCPSI